MLKRWIFACMALCMLAGFLVAQVVPQQIVTAQEDTDVRFYIMPIMVVNETYRGPKYLKWRLNPEGIDCLWSMKDYGLINAALVAADVTQAQHEALVAEPDVAAAPVDIDQNINEIAIPQVQAVMEALRIPADWITSEYTYRDILRMIGGLFMFAQRYHGMHNEQLIDNTDQLDLRWNQIPLARRQKIIATADELGYDYSEVQNTWLVRRILKHLGNQWSDTPIIFGNLVTL
jgi:hypothetical protein